jgi:hypothetical protein
MFRRVKAREGWRSDRIHRSYITPSSIHASDHTQKHDHRRYKKKTPRRGYVHTMPLHYTEKFHHNFRRRANENLALSTALSIDDAFLKKVAFR